MNPSPIVREYLERGCSASCPIIDMHGHLGTVAGGYLPLGHLDDLVSELDRCGVRWLVCSHHTALMFDVARGNDLMQAAIDAHPDRLLGYWAINPHSQDLRRRHLQALGRARGFVGLKLLPDYHCVPVTSDRYAPALEHANEHGLLVLVHSWGFSEYDSPALVGEAAARYPNARFLMGHSGHGDWETAAEIGRELPNVFLEISCTPTALNLSRMPAGSVFPGSPVGSQLLNGLLEYLVEVAGSRKVVFGTDIPWCGEHYGVGAVLFAQISDHARHDILHRNAERLLGK